MSKRIDDIQTLAEELTGAGRHAEAINHFKELCAAQPGEPRHMVRIADAYRRLGTNAAAIVWYARAARTYAGAGLLPKAVTIAKLILAIDPAHKQTQAWLAALYANPERPVARPNEPEAVEPPSLSMELLSDFQDEDSSAESDDDAYFQGGISFDDEAAPETTADADPTTAPESGDEEILVLDDAPEEAALELVDEDDADDIIEAEVDGVSLEELVKQLPRVPIFSDLNAREFKRLIDHVTVQLYEAGENVVREGEKGDAFFIITSGTATVTKRVSSGREVELATLHEGTFFGEFAYLAGSERSASVTAQSTLEVLAINRESMDALTREHPRIRKVLKRFYSDRIIKNLLAISPLFESLKEDEKRALMTRFKYVSVPPKTDILVEGGEGDGLYVIVRGAVEILRATGSGVPESLARLHEGEFFGEMSILAGSTASATVRSLDKTGLLKLPAAAFDSVAEEFPGLVKVIRSFAEDRMRKNEETLILD